MATSKIYRLRRYTQWQYAQEILQKGLLPLLPYSSWDDEDDKFFLDIHKGYVGKSNLIVCCLTSGNESYSHWRRYSNSDGANVRGVCIVFNYEKILERFKFIKDIIHNPVSYKKSIRPSREYEPLNCAELAFSKKNAFSTESEYRIVSYKDHVEIDISGCVDEVLWDPWDSNVHIRELKEIEGMGYKCRKSDILKRDKFRQAIQHCMK